MKRAFFARAGLLALLASASFLAVCPAQAGSYDFNTYNNSGDPNFNQLLGINSAGTIAGYFGDGTVSPNKGYTFVRPSTYSNENFPGSAQTQVTGINSLATPTTVGFWVDGAGNNFGFFSQFGSFTTVVDPNTPTTGTMTNQLLGVNNSNVAVGFYVNSAGNDQGYTYNIGSNTYTPVTLPSSFNAVNVTATGINNLGDISGFYTNSVNTNTLGFLDIGGTFTSLPDPLAGTSTMILGLNDNGEAVGNYTDAAGNTHGFVYDWLTNTWQTVDDPSASQTAAFNVAGTTVNGINDAGTLVGFYSDGTNVNGFVASPVPEPSTWAMMLVGFAGLGALSLRARGRRSAAAA